MPMTEVHEEISTDALEARARRAAKSAGYRAFKSRRAWSIDNLGGFALLNMEHNCIVLGAHFDLSAANVIDFCKQEE